MNSQKNKLDILANYNVQTKKSKRK